MNLTDLEGRMLAAAAGRDWLLPALPDAVLRSPAPPGMVDFLPGVPAEQVAAMSDRIAAIPYEHLSAAFAAGKRLVIYPGRLTDLPRFAAVAGSRLPDGRLYDELPGLYAFDTAFAAGWSPDWVVWHEFGHERDDAGGVPSAAPGWLVLLRANPIPLEDGPGWEDLSADTAEAYAIVYADRRAGRDLLPAPLAAYVDG